MTRYPFSLIRIAVVSIVLSRAVVLILLSSVQAAEAAWPEFRGPGGDGHAVKASLPIEWSEEQNVAWKTRIHDRGWSSPVVDDRRIWLTTATKDGHQLFAVCVDKHSGAILHDVPLFRVESPMRITEDNTYATPTPLIVDRRVVAHFGTYGTACLDVSTGQVLWTRRDLNCDHEAGAGPASSPALINGNIVVHVDGRDEQYIVALNPANGETVWKTQRSIDFTDIPLHHRKAFCMPYEIPRGDGRQIVSPGGRALYSYDLQGNELWRIQHRGFSIAPRPVYGRSLVFAVIDRDHPELWAIRPDGSGDVSDTHVAWKATRSMPPRCSPMLVGDLLYVINRQGIMSCLEADSGELVWKERLKGRYSASPIYDGDHIYLFNEQAATTVIRPGRRFEAVASNTLAEAPVLATPAVDGDALIIRTENHLYRIQP